MININEYIREKICEYKGEVYTVRDNGAIMRHIRDGKKVRKLDNVWTFGTKDKTKGYMMINSHRVHIIVATAFIPGNEDGKMIVDHIDTNRCNNRVENLRWLTRLENVLLNEATLKRVTYLCGGDINKFIENPSCLRDLNGANQDIMWMRTVTAEEAKLAWERISAWAKRPSPTFKIMQQREYPKNFNEWLKVHEIKEDKQILSVYSNIKRSEMNEKQESLTKGAFQIGFYNKMFFPLCPENTKGGLDAYANNLNIGRVITCSENGEEYLIKSVGWTLKWNAILVNMEGEKPISKHYMHISCENGNYIHCVGDGEPFFQFCDSPYILQCGARTQCYFPLCPKDGNITLEGYANILRKDVVCEKNQHGEYYVYDREITHCDGTMILYVGVMLPENYVKPYGDMIIFIENGKVIHQIEETYFDEKSLQRNFCKIRGQEWDNNEEIFDDYC